MKTIFRLAKTELRILFCSPVSWLILVIFAFQAGMAFSNIFDIQLKRMALGYGLYGVTQETYARYSGLLVSMLKSLYLYIPLITMGLMSREYSSGSIKFLYSSPITNTQIILGKYSAMIIYAIVLMAILSLYIIFGIFTIHNMNVAFVLSGLLGLFLLTCAYAAIGLFMSSITSYQVVAAMGTLAILAVLNFIGDIGQDIAFVRDITYWLSMSGRSYVFLRGMICSEDVLYFVIIITLFIILSITRLQSTRKKRTRLASYSRYSCTICIALLLGCFSTLPTFKLYYDATETKANTLTPGSQEIVKQLKGGLTITTYMNILDKNYGVALPSQLKHDFERFEQYMRFKPEIKMKYVYYYDTPSEPSYAGNFPELEGKERAEKICKTLNVDFNMFLSPEQIQKIIDLKPEGNRFIRVIERENGQKTFLRLFNDIPKHPSETEITTALKRFLVKSPKVGFLIGHGERSLHSTGDRYYYNFAKSIFFRHSLINQGFDVIDLSIKDTEIPADIDIIVISDMRTALNAEENEKIKNYIQHGGNLFILGEPGRLETMNPLLSHLGVELMPGTLVQLSEGFSPSLITATLTEEAALQSLRYNRIRGWDFKLIMPTATGIKLMDNKGYKISPLVVSTSQKSWNELETTDFVDGEFSVNTQIGEKEQSYPVVLALTKKVGEKEQRIIVTGDADCISNGELSTKRNGIGSANFDFITESFKWLSYGEFPIETFRPEPTDNSINISRKASPWIKTTAMGTIPCILLFTGLMIWSKRKKH